jgi:death-on-curing protein
MRYLSPHDLLIIHQSLLTEFGGMVGITEAGFSRLETAAATPRQTMFGDDLYPDLASKAAALVFSITRNHPFSDGNKRVAVVALDVMLTRNGWRLTASNDAMYDLAMAAANGLEREAIEEWVRGHMQQEPEHDAGDEDERTTRHLSLKDILSIRDDYAAVTGEAWRFELENFPALVSSLTTPFQAVFGQQSFPTLIEKAAALVFLLIANHPFRDGNKRIAASALRRFLERNGYRLAASDEELRVFTYHLTQHHSPRDEWIVQWVGERAEPAMSDER